MQKSMIRYLLMGSIALIIVLFLLFIFFMTKLTPLSHDSNEAYYQPKIFNEEHPVSMVYELQSLSLASSLAALSTTTKLNSDFDKVTNFLPKMNTLRTNLQKSELNSLSAPKELKFALGRLINLTRANEEAIEQFKTNYAAIRNSQRYLPISYDTLLLLSKRQADKAEDNINKSGLLKKIKQLNIQLNMFLRNPSTIAKEELSKELLTLEERAMSLPQKISNALLNYTSHAFVLVNRKLPMMDILDRIANDDLQAVDNEIVNFYQQMLTKSQLERQNKQQVLEESYSLYRIIAIVLGTLLALLGIAACLLFLKEYNVSDQQLRLMSKQKDLEFNKQLQLQEKSHVSTSTEANNSYVSRMVASLTHELNTPLGYLSSNMDILKSSSKVIKDILDETEHCKKDLLNESKQEKIVMKFSNSIDTLKEGSLLDELPEIIADMNTGIEQIQHLIGDLNMFSGTDRAKKEWFNLNECIIDVLKLSSVTIGRHIKVLKKFGELPDFYGSRGKITQIFTNLVVNSVHAIEEGKPSQGVIKIVTVSKPNIILVEFLDNGIGIDSENAKKVFEPFFTTKEPSKGTGLGLAIVSQIVQDHKGKIAVNSKLGQGTSLKIAFPVQNKKV
ncbi:MAG: HAMP domain-containing histidine kinase [Gammaproteobacteria bacterium]|nr:HAMP domain-containing histidine kinase [Gammaproteobacteria bacterium]